MEISSEHSAEKEEQPADGHPQGQEENEDESSESEADMGRDPSLQGIDDFLMYPDETCPTFEAEWEHMKVVMFIYGRHSRIPALETRLRKAPRGDEA